MSGLRASYVWKAGLIIILMVFTGCQRPGTSSSKGILINGELKGATVNALVRLSELDVKSVKPIDSVHIGDDGRFSFDLNPATGSFYLLTLSSAQKLILVAQSGDKIQIKADARNIVGTARITGSASSSWILDFERFTSRNNAKSDSLARIFMNSRSDQGFARIRQHIDSAYQDIVQRQRVYMEKFIDLHPASLASLLVLNRKFGPNFMFNEEKDSRYFIKVDSGLMAKYPGNKHVLDHHNRVVALKKKISQRLATDSSLMPGKQVPELRLTNVEGITVPLSSLKGKVTLIYFWAAMNARSRQFIRQLIPLYKANKKKGFAIFGIALEPNRELWLNALNLDQPGGIQVNADEGIESSVASLFGIELIPEAMLVDRQGKIIKRKISLDELRLILPVQLQLK